MNAEPVYLRGPFIRFSVDGLDLNHHPAQWILMSETRGPALDANGRGVPGSLLYVRGRFHEGGSVTVTGCDFPVERVKVHMCWAEYGESGTPVASADRWPHPRCAIPSGFEDFDTDYLVRDHPEALSNLDDNEHVQTLKQLLRRLEVEDREGALVEILSTALWARARGPEDLCEFKGMAFHYKQAILDNERDRRLPLCYTLGPKGEGYRQQQSKHGPPYSEDFKARVVRLVREGRTSSSITDELGPTRPTIRRWVQEAEEAVEGTEAGKPGPTPDIDLRQRVSRLTEELEEVRQAVFGGE